MKYNNHNNKGLTLIELLIVIGIMGVIITAIFSFFISSLKTFNRADDQIQAQNNAQAAMNRIVDEIIGGQALESTVNNNGNYTVTFQINDDESIIYDHNIGDQTIRRRGEVDYIATNITEFNVSGTNGITITITSRINDSEVTLTNEIYLRNGSNL